jgi:hypothetical protein
MLLLALLLRPPTARLKCSNCCMGDGAGTAEDAMRLSASIFFEKAIASSLVSNTFTSLFLRSAVSSAV